jgi:hypothetical protein
MCKEKEKGCVAKKTNPQTKVRRRNDEIMYKVGSTNVGMLRKKFYGMN